MARHKKEIVSDRFEVITLSPLSTDKEIEFLLNSKPDLKDFTIQPINRGLLIILDNGPIKGGSYGLQTETEAKTEVKGSL